MRKESPSPSDSEYSFVFGLALSTSVFVRRLVSLGIKIPFVVTLASAVYYNVTASVTISITKNHG